MSKIYLRIENIYSPSIKNMLVKIVRRNYFGHIFVSKYKMCCFSRWIVYIWYSLVPLIYIFTFDIHIYYNSETICKYCSWTYIRTCTYHLIMKQYTNTIIINIGYRNLKMTNIFLVI